MPTSSPRVTSLKLRRPKRARRGAGSHPWISVRMQTLKKIGDKQSFVLQVNSQAKNTALKEFVARNRRGTHAQIAVVSFDTKAADPEQEAKRVVDEMKAQSKSKLE